MKSCGIKFSDDGPPATKPVLYKSLLLSSLRMD